jgi:hypothetical protein
MPKKEKGNLGRADESKQRQTRDPTFNAIFDHPIVGGQGNQV